MADRLTLQARLDAIWDEAERRMLAGEKTRRHLLLAYAVPPGDGDFGFLPWLSEAESIEAHELVNQLDAIQRQHDAGALDRLRAKHAARRAAHG